MWRPSICVRFGSSNNPGSWKNGFASATRRSACWRTPSRRQRPSSRGPGALPAGRRCSCASRRSSAAGWKGKIHAVRVPTVRVPALRRCRGLLDLAFGPLSMPPMSAARAGPPRRWDLDPSAALLPKLPPRVVTCIHRRSIIVSRCPTVRAGSFRLARANRAKTGHIPQRA